MATLSSTSSGSTLSRLQPNNNPSSVHQHTTVSGSNGSNINVSTTGLGFTDSAGSNPKAAWSKESGRMATATDESANDASHHKKIAVVRDRKSLDYITRTMLAGGIAGITVSHLFYCWIFC